jgi:hypothetical protein
VSWGWRFHSGKGFAGPAGHIPDRGSENPIGKDSCLRKTESVLACRMGRRSEAGRRTKEALNRPARLSTGSIGDNPLKDLVSGPKSDLDFLPPDFDFVAGGLDFISMGPM